MVVHFVFLVYNSRIMKFILVSSSHQLLFYAAAAAGFASQ